jgi:hypothetical protein
MDGVFGIVLVNNQNLQRGPAPAGRSNNGDQWPDWPRGPKKAAAFFDGHLFCISGCI